MAAASTTQPSHHHHISEDDVLQAPMLAKQGQQRLCDIVHGAQNSFRFNVFLDQRPAASVELHVTPVHRGPGQATLYDVEGRYMPLDDNGARADEMLKAAQLVYDTYIRVVPLKVTKDILKHCPRLTTTPVALSRTPASTAIDTIMSNTSGHPPPHENGNMAIPASTVDPAGEEALPAVNGQERNANATSSQGRDMAGKLRLYATQVANAIRRGLYKAEVRKILWSEQDMEAGYEYVVSHVPVPDEGRGSAVYLDQVENQLSSAMKEEPDDKTTAWINWFFLSNLQLVREHGRDGRKHLPLKGAKLANLIVNKLLISDGVAALGVYNALAEMCSRFTFQSNFSIFNIERISSMVANDLHGQLSCPTSHSQIPFPALWLSTLFRTVS
ncbi:hypothetical protein J3F83DRAFT_88737 [Trichoderma novae-zelandiae]